MAANTMMRVFEILTAVKIQAAVDSLSHHNSEGRDFQHNDY
jgi:hypothetical protein